MRRRGEGVRKAVKEREGGMGCLPSVGVTAITGCGHTVPGHMLRPGLTIGQNLPELLSLLPGVSRPGPGTFAGRARLLLPPQLSAQDAPSCPRTPLYNMGNKTKVSTQPFGDLFNLLIQLKAVDKRNIWRSFHLTITALLAPNLSVIHFFAHYCY